MSANQAEVRQLVELTEGSKDQFISTAIRNTAGAIVEDAAKVKPGQRVLIWFDAPGIELVKQMDLRCKAIGADVKFFMRDYEGDAAALAHLDEDGVRHMFDEEAELMDWAENVLIVRNPEDPEAMGGVPLNKAKMYADRYDEVHKKRFSNQLAWTLFLFPTEYEARKEGLPYDEYFRQYMEACNQPWGEIKKKQVKVKDKLDKGNILELHANENDPDPMKQTHVTMNIEGMTFCNTTIDNNYPGPEVFSAPVLHSVNGQIYAEGQYLYDGHLMRNILLKIKNGRIVKAYAEEGNDGLQAILDRDDKKPGFGSRFFGEVALGTNPGLTRRFFNQLLNEKVGGSFHMAVGHCYTYTTYDGEPVMVNNGNAEDKTSVHWDLTILMHRKADGSGGGRVVVDGDIIQQDGKFIDPELGILNPKI